MADLPLHPPPTLRYADDTHALVIRPARVTDAEELMEAFEESREALKAFMPWAHMENTVPQQQERLAASEQDHQDGGDVVFHLYDGATDRFLGCTGLHFRCLNRRAVEVGYWVRTSEAGKGWTTLVVKCLTVLVFDYLNFDRFQCAYNEPNEGSRRVNEKVGFHVEGRHRYYEGQPTEEMRNNGSQMAPDTITTALTRHDPPNLSWYAAIAEGLTVWDPEGNLVVRD